MPTDVRREHGLRKALKIEMVADEGSLRDRFAIAREAGFEGVELPSPNGWSEQEVLDAREETGLRVHGVVCAEHWRSPLNHADARIRGKGIDAVSEAVEDAARYGATSVLVVPGVVDASNGYDAAWEASYDSICEVLPAATTSRIDLLLENVWNRFLLSPREAVEFVDRFESPRVGWYLDVGNVIADGWPEQWIRILGGRIGKVDVKDFSRAERERAGAAAGFAVDLLDGDCDWPSVVDALVRIGYQGWLTAEVEGGSARRLREIATRMDRIIDLRSSLV